MQAEHVLLLLLFIVCCCLNTYYLPYNRSGSFSRYSAWTRHQQCMSRCWPHKAPVTDAWCILCGQTCPCPWAVCILRTKSTPRRACVHGPMCVCHCLGFDFMISSFLGSFFLWLLWREILVDKHVWGRQAFFEASARVGILQSCGRSFFWSRRLFSVILLIWLIAGGYSFPVQSSIISFLRQCDCHQYFLYLLMRMPELVWIISGSEESSSLVFEQFS